MPIVRYKNSFYKKSTPESKPVLFCDKGPVEYKGYLIYQRMKDCFDIVKDGVCIGMYAGINGAKKSIDNGKF
jgi:hypothetical protein